MVIKGQFSYYMFMRLVLFDLRYILKNKNIPTMTSLMECHEVHEYTKPSRILIVPQYNISLYKITAFFFRITIFVYFNKETPTEYLCPRKLDRG